MIRALVAFYSRSGVTRHVAHQLARRLGADLLELRDVRPRDGMLGYMRSALEAMHGTLPDIAHKLIDPADYDLVLLGTPVWASHVSSPMRRFLYDNAGGLRRRVAFFCTMGDRGADGAFGDMRDLLGKDAEATCALLDRDILQDGHLPALDAFVAKLAKVRRTTGTRREGVVRASHAHM